jgi:hypothetical protein
VVPIPTPPKNILDWFEFVWFKEPLIKTLEAKLVSPTTFNGYADASFVPMLK